MQPLPCLAHDLESFLADIGFGYCNDPSPDLTTEDMGFTTPEEEGTSVAAGAGAGDDDDERRRLRRRISNRESARRSRARKQRHLEEQRATAAVLRAGNRDLATRLRGARARAGLVALANARLRAEADALGRRLAAARRALALRELYNYAAGLDAQTQLASLIA